MPGHWRFQRPWGKRWGLTWHFWMRGSWGPWQAMRLEVKAEWTWHSVHRVKKESLKLGAWPHKYTRLQPLGPQAQNQRWPPRLPHHPLLDWLETQQLPLTFNPAQLVVFSTWRWRIKSWKQALWWEREWRVCVCVGGGRGGLVPAIIHASSNALPVPPTQLGAREQEP